MSRYDVDKFNPTPDPDLVCCICTCILDEPLVSPCQHVFCKVCIHTWLERKKTCPTCRTRLVKDDLQPVLPLVRNMLNRLTMVCDYRQNGCETVLHMEQFDAHIRDCQFEMVTCRYERCVKQLLRRDIHRHEDEECDFKEVKCPNCELDVPVKEMPIHDCIVALKTCMKGMKKTIADLKEALKTCKEEVSNLEKKLEEQRWNTLDDSWDSNSSWESWETHSDYSGSYTSSDDGHSSNADTNNSPFQLSVRPMVLSTMYNPLGLSSSITTQSNSTNISLVPSTSVSTAVFPSFTHFGASNHSQDDTLSASENSDHSDRHRRRQNQRLVSERHHTDTSQSRSLLDAYTSLGTVVEEAFRDSAHNVNVLQSRYSLESVLEPGSSPPPAPRGGRLSYSSPVRPDHTVFESNPSSPVEHSISSAPRSRSRSRSLTESRNSVNSSNRLSRKRVRSYDYSDSSRSASSESEYWPEAGSLVRSRSVDRSFRSDTELSEGYDRSESRSRSIRSSKRKRSKHSTRSRSEYSERSNLESSYRSARRSVSYDRRSARSRSRSHDRLSRRSQSYNRLSRSRTVSYDRHSSRRRSVSYDRHSSRRRSVSYDRHSSKRRSVSHDHHSSRRSVSHDRHSPRRRSVSHDRHSPRRRSVSHDRHSSTSRTKSFDRSDRSRYKSFAHSSRGKSKSPEHSWSGSPQGVRSWLSYLDRWSRKGSPSSEHSGKCRSNTRSRSRSSEHSGREIYKSDHRNSRSVRRQSWQSERSHISDNSSNRSLVSHSRSKLYSRSKSGGMKSDYSSRSRSRSLSVNSDWSRSRSRHSMRSRSCSPSKSRIIARGVLCDSSSSESEINTRSRQSLRHIGKRLRSESRNNSRNRKSGSEVKSNTSHNSQSQKRSYKRIKRDISSSSDSTIVETSRPQNQESVVVEQSSETLKSTKQQTVLLQNSTVSESTKRQLKNCSQNSNKPNNKSSTSNPKKTYEPVGTTSVAITSNKSSVENSEQLGISSNSKTKCHPVETSSLTLTSSSKNSTENCDQPGISNVASIAVSRTAKVTTSATGQDSLSHGIQNSLTKNSLVSNSNLKKRKKDVVQDSAETGKSKVTAVSAENRCNLGDAAKVNVEICLSVLNFPGEVRSRTSASNSGTGKSRSCTKTKCSADVDGKKSVENNQKISDARSDREIPHTDSQSTAFRNNSDAANSTSNAGKAYSFRKSTVDKIIAQSSKGPAESSRESTRRSSRQVKPCKTMTGSPVLPSYFMEEDSDDSWTPSGLREDSDVSPSQTDSTGSDSSYEVQVPKPLMQIIDEMVEGEESDNSWTPD